MPISCYTPDRTIWLYVLIIFPHRPCNYMYILELKLHTSQVKSITLMFFVSNKNVYPSLFNNVIPNLTILGNSLRIVRDATTALLLDVHQLLIC